MAQPQDLEPKEKVYPEGWTRVLNEFLKPSRDVDSQSGSSFVSEDQKTGLNPLSKPFPRDPQPCVWH